MTLKTSRNLWVFLFRIVSKTVKIYLIFFRILSVCVKNTFKKLSKIGQGKKMKTLKKKKNYQRFSIFVEKL
jgi:hypothetical protein